MKLVKRLSLRLPSFLYERLRKIAERRHEEISDVAREAIDVGITEMEKRDAERNKCSLLKGALSKYLTGNTQAITKEEILAIGYLVHDAYENSKTGIYYDVGKVHKLVEFVYNVVESIKDEGSRNYVYSNIRPLDEYKKVMPFANIGANYPARAFLACIEEGDPEKVKKEILKIINIVLEIASAGILFSGEEYDKKIRCIGDLHKLMWEHVEARFLPVPEKKDIIQSHEVRGFGNENVYFSILFSESLPCRIRLGTASLPVNLWVLMDFIHLTRIYETIGRESELLKISSLFWEFLVNRKQSQGWVTLRTTETHFVEEFSIELRMEDFDDLVDAANKFSSWLGSEDPYAKAISYFRLVYGEI